MDKSQALNNFWNSFNIPAYDEISVPDDAQMPYITYSAKTDSLGNVLPLSASVWYRESTWKNAVLKAEEVAKAIAEYGFYKAEIEGGYMWITKGTPFAQRMSDPNDDMIKRVYLNIMVEFLTAY